jgi:hypothetical protein
MTNGSVGCGSKNMPDNKKFKIMKRILISTCASLIAAAVLVLSSNSAQAQAQDVTVSGTLTDVAAGGGVFDYTLTLKNTGSESIEGLWLGWALSSSPVFNVVNPTAAGNNLGWASVVDGNSVQYGGSSSETTLAPGSLGTFTFNSTSTPAQFTSGAAGQSVAYGVAASQFAIEDNTQHSVEFSPALVPEPSTYWLFFTGLTGFLCIIRRKQYLKKIMPGKFSQNG